MQYNLLEKRIDKNINLTDASDSEFLNGYQKCIYSCSFLHLYLLNLENMDVAISFARDKDRHKYQCSKQ